MEVDAWAAGAALAAGGEPGALPDSGELEDLAELAGGDDSLLARRAVVAAGGLAGKHAETGADAPDAVLAIILRAAADARYRVRLAAGVAADGLSAVQRDVVRMKLLDYPDVPSDDLDRGNYIVKVAVLEGIDEHMSPDLRAVVQELTATAAVASVRAAAQDALARTDSYS